MTIDPRCTRILCSLLVVAVAALVSNATGAASLEVFSCDPPFSIYNVAGRTLTLKGISFTPSTTVTIDGVAATATFVNSRTLTVALPTVAAAKVSTIVVNDPANGRDEFFPFLYTGPIFYVATTGLDSNAGTSPAAPKRTLGAALAAVSGTTPTEVRVAAGRYQEAQLAILNNTVVSGGWAPGFATRDPDRQVTDIDANRGGFILRTNGLAANSVVDGCTLRNGLRDGFGGGALAITADTTIVNNNVIVGNLSTTMGGGIYFIASTSYGGKPTFSNNVIVGNRAHGKNGGGLVLYANYNTQQPVRVNIAGNYIVGNRSLLSRGGGAALTTGSYAGYNQIAMHVHDNLIGFNRAKTGGGFDMTSLTYGDSFDFTFENNLLVGNRAQGAGGGLSVQGVGAVLGRFRANTVANNSAYPGQTGGFFLSGSLNIAPSFTASDLILWGNAGNDAGGAAVDRIMYSNSGTPLTDWSNISADPGFAPGALGGFYLTQADPNLPVSPSVDAGSVPSTELSLETLTTGAALASDAGTVDHGFHYQPAPSDAPAALSILRIDPPAGDFLGSDWTLIRGDGFDPGVAVAFDSIPASSVVYISPTRILAQPAPHAQGFVNVRVTNPDATFVQVANGYRYVDNEAPTWVSTTGAATATTAVDCARSVVLDWNDAVDGAGSNPVVYEVYREICGSTTSNQVPCSNFGYIPNAVNFIGSTLETTYVDLNHPTGGQDPKYVYTVRARDSATPTTNKEWNFSRRVTLATKLATDTTPPSVVGSTVIWTSSTSLDWPAAQGAVSYAVYKRNTPADFTNPGSLTPSFTLTTLNNDLNGDGITDTVFNDGTVPAPGAAFFYRITALDTCSVETKPADLLP